ncbi:MAG: MotA/TolQ/ExbB proton channel family protein [bacterium]
MEVGIDWVLWLLFGLGGISILILIERVIYFSVYGGAINKTRSELINCLAEGDLEKARQAFRSKRTIAGKVVSEALEHANRAPEAVQEIVESRLMEERQRLERGLSFVGTVGSNAPFIGLFGTVLGIIKAFHDLSLAEQAGTSIVMVGISEALVATAVGLLVAIPSVIIFNVFKTRTKSVLYGTESMFKLFLSRQLDLCLQKEGGSGWPEAERSTAAGREGDGNGGS